MQLNDDLEKKRKKKQPHRASLVTKKCMYRHKMPYGMRGMGYMHAYTLQDLHAYAVDSCKSNVDHLPLVVVVVTATCIVKCGVYDIPLHEEEEEEIWGVKANHGG